MATISAAGDGNFLTGGTWVGGVVPTTGDTAEAAGYTIAVDGNVTCDLLTNTGGGGFTVASGGKTINANITAYASRCLYCTHTSGIVTINGNVTAGSSGAGNPHGVQCYGAGTTNITGNVVGGSGAVAAGYGVLAREGAVVTITGTVTGGSSTGGSCMGAGVFGSGNLSIVGDVYGGSGSTVNYGLYLLNAASTASVSGNCYGSAVNGAHGAYIDAGTMTLIGDATGVFTGAAGVYNEGGALTMTGNVVGSATSSANGLATAAGTTTTITGNVTGGGATNAYGINLSGGTLNITGNVTGMAAVGVLCAGPVTLNVTGNVNGSDTTGGIAGIYPQTTQAVTITVNGNLTAGTQSNSHAISVPYAATSITVTGTLIAKGGYAVNLPVGSLVVIGDVYGSDTTASKYGISIGSAATITGNVIGGGATSAYGINLSGGTLTMTGNVTGGTGTTAYGLNMAAGTTVTITGNVYGKDTHGIYGSSTVTLTINGTTYGSDTKASQYGVIIGPTSGGAVVMVTNAQGMALQNTSGVYLADGTATVRNAYGGTGDNANGVTAFAATANIRLTIEYARGTDGSGYTLGQNHGVGVRANLKGTGTSYCTVRKAVSGSYGVPAIAGNVMILAASDAYVQMRDPNLRTVNLRRGGVPTLGGRIGRGD